MVITEEPPIGSVVLDSMDDAWQRLTGGWCCVVHESEYSSVSWETLNKEYGPVTTVYTP